MRTVKTVFICFVLATISASLFFEGGLWGLSSWRFVSINWGVILCLAVLLFLSGRFADRFFEASEGLGRTRGFRVLAIVVFLLLAFLFRVRHDLWGERLSVAYSIERNLYVSPNAPLGVLLNGVFFRACNSVLLSTAGAATSLLSVIAGACYLLGAFLAAKTVLGGDTGRTVTAARIVFFGGFIILFFGAGGNVPLATLFSLLFIVSAVSFTRGHAPLLVPSALFLIAVLSHVSAIYLLPAMIYLIVEASRQTGRKREVVNAICLIAGALIVLETTLAVLAGSPGPARYIVVRSAAMLSSFGGIRAQAALRDAFNALLFSGPAAVASLVLLIKRSDGGKPTAADAEIGRAEKGLFAALVVPAFLICFAAGWRMEGGLRWHIIASTGPTFALYLIWKLRRRLSRESDVARALTMLAALSIVHTAPLILTNAIPAAAEQRILSLPLPAGRSETILGIRAVEKGNFERAEEWLTVAAEKDSLNDLARYYLGTLHMRNDYYVKAITRFNEASELAPDSPLYRFSLAEALIAYDWYDEAVDQLEWLTATYPDSIKYWKRLGYAKNHGGMYADAIDIYGKVLLMEPSKEDNIEALVSAITNRGSELHREGDMKGARSYYEWAIRLYPIGWAAQNNLAALELEQGNIERAFEILEKALERNPFVSKLNLNMGLVLEKLGRYDEAYRYIRKSLELDPMYSGAEPHLQRLLERASKNKDD
jgi:tetratricopeptide (TPR) repeat protein